MDEDYENLRNKNIAERDAFFADLFQDIKKQKQEVKELEETKRDDTDVEDLENEPPRKRRKRNPERRRSRVNLEESRTYNTRSRAKGLNGDEADDEEGSSNGLRRSKRKLRVLFPWAKSAQRSIDLMKMGVCDVDEEDNDYDDEDHDDDDDYSDDGSNKSNYRATKRRFFKVNKTPYDPASIPSVDEITDEMLENIADSFGQKVYDKNGTSCHQCRQKTSDTKTVCRSGECIGVRGQFCGRCLRVRYGEKAAEALKDPNWTCPPCRGLCNCSICRTREGLAPTGIMVHIAQEEGYSNVLDYLRSTELCDD